MVQTRKIYIYFTLVLLTGLMMLPCAFKQQFKQSFTHSNTPINGKTNAKTCIVFYTTLQQQQAIEQVCTPDETCVVKLTFSFRNIVFNYKKWNVIRNNGPPYYILYQRLKIAVVA